MSKQKALLIGGELDGETISIKPNQDYVELLPKVDLSDSPFPDSPVQRYYRWDLHYRDDKGKTHNYNVFVHEDISDVGAMTMLVDNYNPKQE